MGKKNVGEKKLISDKFIAADKGLHVNSFFLLGQIYIFEVLLQSNIWRELYFEKERNHWLETEKILWSKGNNSYLSFTQNNLINSYLAYRLLPSPVSFGFTCTRVEGYSVEDMDPK